MAIINNSFTTYRTDLSQWCILRLADDGTWEALNPKSSIDEEFVNTPELEAELTEKINGYINAKEFVGAVLAVGIFRRLEEDDEASLAAIYSLHTKLVYDKDAVHEMEQTRLSKWLSDNGADESSVSQAEFEENKAGDDSTGYDPEK